MSLSKINSRFTEEYLRFEPEGKFIERKGRDAKVNRIAQELVGMLNAGGGVLVYGVEDDGTVSDLSRSELSAEIPHDLDLYRKIVANLIAPPANIEIEEVYFSEGQLVFLYHVEPDYERVYQIAGNEAVYLRLADSNKGPLKREEVAKLEYNRGIRKFEEEVRLDFDPEDLDTALCETYRKAMNFTGTFEKLAYKRHLAGKKDGKIVYKNAAILLFAEDPERYIANALVRYVRYQGTERKPGKEYNVIKDQWLEGAIPRLLKKLEVFIEASLRDYYYLDIDKGIFIRVPEFPKDAWLEGIVNALYHRSYNVQGNPIMIRHFDDRLEISNSGPLPAQVTVDNIQDEKFTRNVRIARTLNELGYVKELNEGVPRIHRIMREFTLPSPEYKDDGNTVTLILRNRVSDHKETISANVFERIENAWFEFNPSQRQIIAILFEENELTIDGLISNMELSEAAIRLNLKSLQKEEILERVSTKERDRNAIYRFSSR